MPTTLVFLQDLIGVVGFAQVLTAGRHRFEAVSRFRLPDAPCIIVTEDDLNAELAMIDENLCRTDMTLAERARIMVRRKELHEEKYPESRRGTVSARAANAVMGRNVTENVSVTFAASTAAAIGKNERGVRLDVQCGTEITDEALTLVTRTPLDNARYLDTLKRVPKPEQVERVQRDLADPPVGTKPTADAACLA